MTDGHNHNLIWNKLQSWLKTELFEMYSFEWRNTNRDQTIVNFEYCAWYTFLIDTAFTNCFSECIIQWQQ